MRKQAHLSRISICEGHISFHPEYRKGYINFVVGCDCGKDKNRHCYKVNMLYSTNLIFRLNEKTTRSNDYTLFDFHFGIYSYSALHMSWRAHNEKFRQLSQLLE